MYILGILVLVFFVVPPLISTAIGQTTPDFQVTETAAISGTPGYSITTSTQAPVRNVTIYSGYVLDSSADWMLENAHYQTNLDHWGVKSVQREEKGVRLNLAGYHKFQDNYFDSEAFFRGRPSFPVMNYSDVQFSVSINVLSGDVAVTLRVRFKDSSSFEWSEMTQTSRQMEAGDDQRLVLSPSRSVINTLTTGSFAESAIGITIFSEVPAEVIIGEVSVIANSREDLYPVSFDIQAQDGASLFSNQYTNKVGGLIRERWTGATTMSSYYYLPALRLTDTGNESDASLLLVRETNQTFYLREGTYSGFAGWVKMDSSSGLDALTSGINITITVTSNQALSVQIKILVTRLSMILTPNFAYTRIEIDAANSTEFYYVDYPFTESEFLYLPPLATFNLKVKQLQYDYRNIDDAHLTYSQQNQFVSVVSKANDSNIDASVVFPVFAAMGFIFDLGFVIAIVALIGIIGIVLLAIYENRGWRDPYIQPSLLPLSVILISVFTPWISYSFLTGANPETTIYGNIFVPILTTLWDSMGGSANIAPNVYLLPNIILLAVLYWLPIGYLLLQIVYKRKVIIIRELQKIDTLILIDILLGPLVMGIFALDLCLNGFCSINIGLIATLALLPAWIIAKVLEDRRMRKQ